MRPLAERSIPSTSPFSILLPYCAIQMPVWRIQQGSTVLGLQDFLHHCQVFLGRCCLLVTTKTILLFSLLFHEQHGKAKVTSSRKHFYILCSFLPRRSTRNNFPLLKKVAFTHFLSFGSSSTKQWRIYTGDAT